MTIDFKLPELGENIESADVVEILVAEGDRVDVEQIVMELETEKAVVELPCPYAGTVAKIHVTAGEEIKVGRTILTIEESVAPDTAAPSTADGDDTVSGKKTSKPAATSDGTSATTSSSSTKSAAASAKPTTQDRSARERSADDGRGTPPPPAGPATRRLARELGVDLHNVSGSGGGGRITAQDVKAFVRSTIPSAGPGGVTAAAAPQLPDFTQFGPVERQRLNKIGRTAAAGLSRAWQVIPHVTQHDLADVTELEAARRRFVKAAAPSQAKVTLTAIVIKAVVSALKAFPHVNASYDSQAGELILKRYYHIGVAVDTEHGLLVPVIRNADEKSILDVAEELADLAERARSRKLDPADMQGATFTITNLGGIGGTAFTPIVNWPEVAILGLSRSRNELRLVDGAPVERLLLPLSLSYDHRVINGALAARFVVTLAGLLTDSFRLLVES
ncbi:MAG: 2-oxo acid dehydrogenase subunit E2 [Planctomycetes bacterium]|nr:2-oxo acid dehydrogenase subunit E2 [Planctomycetota bacterium]